MNVLNEADRELWSYLSEVDWDLSAAEIQQLGQVLDISDSTDIVDAIWRRVESIGLRAIRPPRWWVHLSRQWMKSASQESLADIESLVDWPGAGRASASQNSVLPEGAPRLLSEQLWTADPVKMQRRLRSIRRGLHTPTAATGSGVIPVFLSPGEIDSPSIEQVRKLCVVSAAAETLRTWGLDDAASMEAALIIRACWIKALLMARPEQVGAVATTVNEGLWRCRRAWVDTLVNSDVGTIPGDTLSSVIDVEAELASVVRSALELGDVWPATKWSVPGPRPDEIAGASTYLRKHYVVIISARTAFRMSGLLWLPRLAAAIAVGLLALVASTDFKTRCSSRARPTLKH